LKPVIDALSQPIPGLQDLAKNANVKITILGKDAATTPITFLDLLDTLATQQNLQPIGPFLKILNAVNTLPAVPTSNVQIDLGHFTVSDPRPGQTIAKVVTATPAKGDATTPRSALNRADTRTGSFFPALKSALQDVSSPLLEDPASLFPIFTGKLPEGNKPLFLFTPPKVTNGGFNLHAD